VATVMVVMVVATDPKLTRTTSIDIKDIGSKSVVICGKEGWDIWNDFFCVFARVARMLVQEFDGSRK
jgi:hypothetical protein